MNRPTRKWNHLVEKVARKEAVSLKKPGTRTKRWRKWVAAYKDLATSSAPQS